MLLNRVLYTCYIFYICTWSPPLRKVKDFLVPRASRTLTKRIEALGKRMSKTAPKSIRDSLIRTGA